MSDFILGYVVRVVKEGCLAELTCEQRPKG